MKTENRNTTKSWLLTSIDALVVTCLTFAVAWFFFIVPLSFKIFNPIKRSLAQLELLDFYHSDIRGNQTRFSEQQDLVLLNIGNLGRREIAQVLDSLESAGVGAVAIDLVFKDFLMEKADTLLARQMKKMQTRLVLANILTEERTIGTHPFFGDFSEGYANVVNEGMPRYSAVRQVKLRKHGHYAFAFEAIQKFDPKKSERLKKRYPVDSALLINYWGSYERFLRMEHTEGFDRRVLSGKLVLLGDFGSTFGDTNRIADRHHTSVNAHGTGVGFPDMAGPLLQANIILMLLNDDLIREIPNSSNWCISLGLTFLLLLPIIRFHKRKSAFFSSAMKLLQITLAFLLLFVCIEIYVRAGIKFSPKYLLLLMVLCVDVLHLYRALTHKVSQKLQPKPPNP